MGIPKKLEIDDDLGIEDMSPSELMDNKKKTWKSKRGAKSELSPKPKGAVRVLTDGEIITNRPKLIYKERVVDKDTHEASWVIWFITERSEYHGIEELVKFNPRTEEEIHKGFDYTIPFTLETAKKLIKESFGDTKFYIKDGVPTYEIKQEDLDQIFLKEYIPKLTPQAK